MTFAISSNLTIISGYSHYRSVKPLHNTKLQ